MARYTNTPRRKSQPRGGRIGSPLTNISKKVGYVAEGSDSIQFLSISKTDSSTSTKVEDPGEVEITNDGQIPISVILVYQAYTTSTAIAGDATDNNYQGSVGLHVLLMPQQTIYPPVKGVVSVKGASATTTNANFANQTLQSLDGTVVDWTAPNSNAYVADGDTPDVQDMVIDGSGLASGTTATSFTIDDNEGSPSDTTGALRIGDLIQIENEILRVTGITAGSTEGTLTVERGMFGSTAATHADNTVVRLPFFNMYGKWNATNKLATTIDGKWHSMNCLGYGREYSDGKPIGIVPGSFCIKIYYPGFQEFGMNAITPSTESGLSASTTYYIKVQCDGSSATEISISLGSNTTFGGNGGVIQKLQEALDAEYYNASSNLFEKKVIVSIVDGDLRFTSGQHLSTSAIALTAGTSGADTTTELLAQAIGRFPALANIKDAVPASLPDTTVYDPITYGTTTDKSEIAYDDGRGNIRGMCTGSLNYETGELSLKGTPSLANFQISLAHTSPYSGKRDSGSATTADDNEKRANSLIGVYANVANDKMTGSINIKTYSEPVGAHRPWYWRKWRRSVSKPQIY